MEHSRARRQLLRAGIVLVEWAGQLLLSGAVLTLLRGRIDGALIGSIAAFVFSVLRGVLIGASTEVQHCAVWRQVVDAARQIPLTELRARREEREGVVMLIDGARESAMYEAVLLPQLAGKILAFATLLVAAVLLLGPMWLGLGAAAVLPMALLASLTNRRVRAAQVAAWSAFGELGSEAKVLLEASTELRAHGRDAAVAEELMESAGRLARAERAVTGWSAVSALVPASFALILVIAPLRAGVTALVELVGGPRLAEVAVVGATAMVLGLGIARSFESLLRAAPARRALASFIARGRKEPSVSNGAEAPRLSSASIELTDVSYVHAGASHATPRRVDLRWDEPCGGLAVIGENGTGKTTLALMLLGLLAPSRGSITVGGRSIRAFESSSFRRQVAYLPQSPFVAPGASIGWHLRVLLGTDLPLEAILPVLARVGLDEVLEERARRKGHDVLETPMGQLSGGERQRLHLARVLLHDAELVILDEPEAGMDTEGRAMLRTVCVDLAASKRVVLIAHDESIVPVAFKRLELPSMEEVASGGSHASEADRLPSIEPAKQSSQGLPER